MKNTTLILLSLAALASATLWLAGPACAQNPLTLVGTYSAEGPENYFGGSMTCGDFNGDRYDEFIIGAWGWNDYMGKVYIYQGGEQFPTQPAWTIQGRQADEGYGTCANVGDVTGDNIEDFAIAASTNGGAVPDARLNLYFGSVLLDTLPDWLFYSPFHDAWNIWDVDSCGDVNGDGGNDFIVDIRSALHDTALVYIFWGGGELDTIPDWVALAQDNGSFVDGLGDVNGDGFADVMVRDYQGPARIYFGGAEMDTIPDVVFDDGYISDWVGAGVRDVNGDSINDVAFCWVFPDTIMPYDVVYFGGPAMNTTPDAWLMKWNGDTSRSLWEMSCGDFNGDGLGDIVGTTGYGFYTRGVQIHLGSANFNTTPDAYVTGPSMYEYGGHVAAGDINGDGHDELLVGEINYPWFYTGTVQLYEGPSEWEDYGVGVVESNSPVAIPAFFHLDQNSPNPFNSATNLRFELQKVAHVNLIVYDLKGNAVKILMQNESMQPGTYNLSWTGTNEMDQEVSSGIYLALLKVNEYTQAIKMLCLR